MVKILVKILLKIKEKYNQGKIYKILDPKLVEYIQERRNLYLPISLAMVQKKALEISTDKNFDASYSWVRNFMKRNNFSLRKRTTKMKQLKEDYLNDVKNHLEKLEEYITDGKDTLYINFDETSFPFNLISEYTIATKGSTQVPILTHSKERETCTVATAVTSDGEFLLPLVIFKYKPSDSKKEEKRKCPKKHETWLYTNYPVMTRFAPKGFNDIKIMKEWLSALKRRLANETWRVVLLLDSATCHTSPDVAKVIENTNIEILFIPGGCTSFLQPLDTDLNKKLKNIFLIITCNGLIH